jgi:hypothetical protein
MTLPLAHYDYTTDNDWSAVSSTGEPHRNLPITEHSRRYSSWFCRERVFWVCVKFSGQRKYDKMLPGNMLSDTGTIFVIWYYLVSKHIVFYILSDKMLSVVLMLSDYILSDKMILSDDVKYVCYKIKWPPNTVYLCLQRTSCYWPTSYVSYLLSDRIVIW